MKKYAIIAAGGSGQRMGNATPKQFIEVAGKAVLWHSVNAFVQAFDGIVIVIVAPAAHMDKAKQVCETFDNVQIVAGGATRFHSVQNGLQQVKEPSVVFVHDAVRCLVSSSLLQRCYEQALDKGSAIPAVPSNDSIRIVSGGSHAVIDRNAVRIIQTPQVFRSEIILPAFDVAYRDSFTDEATVVEAIGNTVHLVEGEQSNIKITRPVDLLIAEQLLGSSSLK